MDILNWLYLAKNKFVRTSIDNPKDLMIFGAKVGSNKRGDIYQNYAMEITDFAATLPAGPTGPQGVAGVAGATGAPGPVGPAGLNWQGAWSAGGTYIIDDAVGYGGASWFCIDPVGPSATTPDTDPTNWALLAAEGAPGSTGATGLQGPTGAAGPSNALSVGTITTLAAGASATATLTGSSPVQVLNLGIPQGIPGGNVPNLEWNATDKTIWNNGQGNIATNTSFGDSALKTNLTGTQNTAVGVNALSSNLVGSNNVAVGYNALFSCLGNSNLAIGSNALLNSIGTGNMAIGQSALSSSVGAASANVAIGFESLKMNVSGFGNTSIGYSASSTATGGSLNTVIGRSADPANFSQSVVLGAYATATASNQFVVGSTTYNAGAVTAQVNTSTKYWSVVINGVTQKVLLA
jgi:hypothetical protein